MARPRKNRTKEPCPCCKIIGFRYPKSFPSNKYYYFRHDDRSFRCPECNSKDCYINDLVKDEDLTNHPFYEQIKHFQRIYDKCNHTRKIIGKYVSALENSSLPINDQGQIRRAAEALKPIAGFVDILDMWSETEFAVLESILKGKTLPKWYLDEVQEIRDLIKEYIGPDSEQFFNTLAEAARKEFRNIDLNYLAFDRSIKKELWKAKIRHAKNYPPKLLGD